MYPFDAVRIHGPAQFFRPPAPSAIPSRLKPPRPFRHPGHVKASAKPTKASTLFTLIEADPWVWFRHFTFGQAENRNAKAGDWGIYSALAGRVSTLPTILTSATPRKSVRRAKVSGSGRLIPDSFLAEPGRDALGRRYRPARGNPSRTGLGFLPEEASPDGAARRADLPGRANGQRLMHQGSLGPVTTRPGVGDDSAGNGRNRFAVA